MIPVFHIVAGLSLWSQARSQRRLARAAEGQRPHDRQRHPLRTLMLLILLGLGMALAVPAFSVEWQPPEDGRSIYVKPPCSRNDADCIRQRIRDAEPCTATA
jgi:hypothetical protein